jgi:Rieske 2Fe-2S family protein
MDYHGVLPDPYFRYSIRIDGVFDPTFLRELEDRLRGRGPRSPRSTPAR